MAKFGLNDHTVKFTPRTLGTCAVGLGLVSATCYLIATGTVADWKLQLGDLGTWVGGTGAAAAALAAAIALRDNTKLRREQENQQRAQLMDDTARRTRRASRVKIRTVPCDTSASAPGWSVALTNQSGLPIYDVRWINLYGMDHRTGEILPEFIRLPVNTEFPDNAPVVLDGESRGIEYLAIPHALREALHVFPQIEFTDDDGYVFRHVIGRMAAFGEIKGRWELVGTHQTRPARPMRLGEAVPPPEIHPVTE